MKLLWIEDDFLLLDGLLAPLKREGVTITTVADYKSAQEAMESASNFDIAIVDLIIPHDQPEPSEPLGLSLVEQLKETAPDLPIMVLTVIRDKDIDIRLEKLGVHIMHKGAVLPSILCEKVREIVEQRKNK